MRIVIEVLVVLFPVLLLMSDGFADSVPSPWTPLSVEGESVTVWGRRYRIGSSGLPSSIIALGDEMLAEPIAFDLGDASSPVFKPCQMHSISQTSVRWESEGTWENLIYRCKGLAEFDGMLRFDVEFAPEGEATLERLWLKVPVRRESASLLHYYFPPYDFPQMTWFFQKDIHNSLARPSSWQSCFTPFVWLGSEKRGLQWFCESDEHWAPADSEKAIEIMEEGEKVFLIIHLIDESKTLDKPFRVTFGLMAGPVKPNPLTYQQSHFGYSHWCTYDVADKPSQQPPLSQLDYLKSNGVKFVGMHEDWTDYQGMPRVSEPEKLRLLVEHVHQRDMGLVLYHSMAIPDIAPEYPSMAPDCICEPITSVYVHQREPQQKDYPACFRSAWSQLFTEGVEQLFREYGIDGLYLDGATTPYWCANQRHGCGYVNSDGQTRPTYPIFAAREQMKKLRQICDAQNKPTLIVAHTSCSITLPTLSFADVLLTGEQYWKKADDFRPTLEFFRTECMGHPHGIPTHFIGYPPLGGEYARTMTALHHAPSPWSPGCWDMWRLYRTFDADSASWHPYWRTESVAVSDNPSILVSGLCHFGEKALLAVGNVTQEPATATLSFNPDLLGFDVGYKSVKDALTESIFEFHEGGVRINLAPESMRWMAVESMQQ